MIDDKIKSERKGARGQERQKTWKSETKGRKSRDKRDFPNGNVEVSWMGDRS